MLRSFIVPGIALSILAGGVSGCTDEEVAVGVGAVAIGAGAVIIADALNDDYTCRPHYRRVEHTYLDHYGRMHHEYRDVWDDCRRFDRDHRRRHYTALRAFASGEADAKSLTDVSRGIPLIPEDFADAFDMSFASATGFVNALRKASEGSYDALVAYGMSREDIARLGNFELPSAASIDALSVKLQQYRITTEGMLNRMRAWGLEEKMRQERENPGRWE